MDSPVRQICDSLPPKDSDSGNTDHDTNYNNGVSDGPNNTIIQS